MTQQARTDKGLYWDRAWSLIEGCSPVSPSCTHCWSARQAHIRARQSNPKIQARYGGLTDSQGRWTGEIRLMMQDLDKPLRVRKPTTWAIWNDLFHPDVPDEFITVAFGVMAACPQHVFLVLTKRPERMLGWFGGSKIAAQVDTFKHVALFGRVAEVFAEEESRAIPGWPDYLITNKGRVLSLRGKNSCLWCGSSLNGIAKQKYCSQSCKSKADYEQRMGRWKVPDSSDPREMRPQFGERGYARMMLYRKKQRGRFLIHRLVLKAFDRAPEKDEQTCHIDGDPTNNALWNLRWGTYSDNRLDSKRHGTHRHYAKLTLEQVKQIRSSQKSTANIARNYNISDTQIRNILQNKQWLEYKAEWPLNSVCLGVSVESPDHLWRIDELLQTPAVVRFVSLEPLLKPINIKPYILPLIDNTNKVGYIRSALDHVIVGGESGPGARECKVEWIRDVIKQCKAADVPVFGKQLGTHWARHTQMGGKVGRHKAHGRPYTVFALGDHKGADTQFWPADLRVREYPDV